MYRIDDELKEFIESGVVVIVGTADADGRPHVCFAWGPRVHEDRGHVSVFIDEARSAVPLCDIGATGLIAMTCSHPVSYRSVQLKGRTLGHGEPASEECEWVRRHRDAVLVSTSLIGDPPQMIRNLWMDGVVRVDFEVEQAFNQTPGPSAGAPL